MKRIICIILVLIMCLALFSCSGKPVQEDAPPVTDDTTANTENTNGEFGCEELNGETFVPPDFGTYDENYAYYENPVMEMCLFASDELVIVKEYEKSIAQWCEVMNIDFAGVIYGGMDREEYISNLEKAAGEYRGIILMPLYGEDYARYAEILNEANCCWMSIGEMRDWSDLEQPLLRPYVKCDGRAMSSLAAEFLVNYADENLAHIDKSRIGVMCVLYSGAEILAERTEQFYFDIAELDDELTKTYAEFEAGYATIDSIEYTFVEELEQNYPEIDHWLCYSPIISSAQTLSDAAIYYGVEDKYTIIGAVFNEEIPENWYSGGDTPIKAVVNVPLLLETELLVGALYSNMIGESEPQYIWDEWTDENDTGYAKRLYPPHLVTKENYQQYLEWTDVYCGADNYDYDARGIARDSFSNKAEVPESYELEIVPEIDTFSQEYVDSCEIIPDDVVNYHPEMYKYRTIKDLSYHAPEVITGKVIEVSYTNDDINPHYSLTRITYPYTVYKIEITESIRGMLKAGDVVQVLEEGGYVYWEEYNEALDSKIFSQDMPHLTEGKIRESFYEDAPPIMEVGTELLLFLHESWMNSYEILGSWTGCYYIENDEVWRYIEYPEKFVFGTLDEAKSEIGKNKFDIDKYSERYGYYN